MEISRRQFLYLSFLSPLALQFPVFAAERDGGKPNTAYPRTVVVLQEAFITEITAYQNYVEYVSVALSEKYPNIAYLFHSFSHSEKIHADNYERILRTLGYEIGPPSFAVKAQDTKSNLQKAAQNELKKINTTYPGFIRELETESHDEAIVKCMYSWKSHQQHEGKVKQIGRYSGMFFGSVSDRIEGMAMDFHVCRVCGSTIDEAPSLPCVICNKPKSNYQRIERPV